ncbi:MAG TPA: hypothetical protein VJ576_06755 [Rhodocyclaceae bacterium]|nr:hypothetical protein [Rhodocyclaceae bacterium]
MGLILDEYSPRARTMAYWSHRFRAFVRHRACRVLPIIVWIAYTLCGALLVASNIISHPCALNDMAWGATIVVITQVVAIPPTLGTHALWRWLSARLYVWLDRHPPTAASIAVGYRLPPRPHYNAPAVILGEAHVTRDYQPDGSYNLDYHIEEQYSPTPEWAVLPASSLVTGLLVFGAIGSGKTADVLRPSIFRLFHHTSHVGGLVMDSKAALVEPLMAEMAAADRSCDLVAIGPRQPKRWNPLHQPHATPATISEALLTAIENINGAPYSADSRWIRVGAAQLIEGAIGLLRLRAGYVTAASAWELLCVLAEATQGDDKPGATTRRIIETLFRGHTINPDQKAQYEYYSRLVVSKFSEDEKFRGIYLSELGTLLVPLIHPDVLGLFNAPESELDMPSWADAINRGLVVVLDCNSRATPKLAVILGMLLKLSYEDAMLARLDWAKAGQVDGERYMALIIDEYQDYASPGDADYLALCRESKSITCFLTQGHASIVQRVGEERTKVMLQSLRNRLILTQTLPDFAADLLGQNDIQEIDRSITESVQDAALHATGRFAGQSSVAESYSVKHVRKHSIPPEALVKLPRGQGILQAHDGNRALPLHRVYLRPYYQLDLRHAEIVALREGSHD